MSGLADAAGLIAMALGVFLLLGLLPSFAPRFLGAVEPKRPALVQIGAAARSLVGVEPGDESVDRLWGASAALIPLVVVHAAIPVLALLVLWGRRIALQRQEKLALQQAGWDVAPEAALILALTVRTGANVQDAIDVVARRSPGHGGEAFAEVSRRLAMGVLLEQALDELPTRLGEPGESISRVIRRCVSTGAQLAPALERLASELRAQQHQRQLEAARRLPILLLFPLVSCTLPAFALLTVVPLLVSSLAQLTG